MSLTVLHLDTERGWRGGERQALWLARELARRGHTSIVAARREQPLSQRATDAGLPVVDCSPVTEADVRAAWRLRRIIRQRGVDVVHAHTAHAVGVGALALVGLDVPLVASRRVDFRLKDNIGTRWKYARAAAIIAISRAVAQVLHASGVSGDRVHVVPDGVDLHRTIVPASAEVLAALGLTPQAPLVVQVAQLVGHKDPVMLVRAMARVHERIPHAQALMVGDGPLRGNVEREIARLGLTRVVRLAGYRADADALLCAATVASLSSREEGMGSVLLDALALGIPVAATRAGGIPEVIVDGETGVLAAPGDPDALADAIGVLLTDGALRSRLSTNGRVRANEFSVERMTDRTVEVYQAVLSPIGGGRRSRTEPTSSSSSASVTRAP